MSSPDTPSLTAIANVEDKQIRFYAIVGATISLTAKLEDLFFQIFYRATGLDNDVIASILFEIKNSSTVRDIVMAAMDSTLKSNKNERPNVKNLTREWGQLKSRIISATGNNGARNVVGHNFVSITGFSIPGPIGSGPIGSGPIGGSIGQNPEFLVEQDSRKVLAGKQKPTQKDFDSLHSYCADLISLETDLRKFLARF